MAKKHVNRDKPLSFQKSRGRSGGPKSNRDGRQRNIGHKKSEEHSRSPKGNRG